MIGPALAAVLLIQDAQQLLQRTLGEKDPEILEYLVERTTPLLSNPEMHRLVVEQALEKAKTGDAMLALVRMMRSRECSPPWLERLVKSKQKATAIRVEAAVGLAELGKPEGVVLLMEEFGRTELTELDKGPLLRMLERKYDVDIRPILPLLAASETPTIRRAAFSVVLLYRDPSGIELLKKIWLDDQDPLRYAALGALLALDVAHDLRRALDDLEAGRVPADCLADLLQGVVASRRESARERLLGSLKARKDAKLAAAILRVLPAYRDSRVAPAVAAALDDPDAVLREAAEDAVLEGAEWMPDDALRALLKHDRAGRRIRSARALLLRDDPSGLDLLKTEAASGDWMVRRDAYRAIAEARPRAALDWAWSGLVDAEERVRIWAERAVTRILATHYPYANVDGSLAGYSALFGSDRQRETGMGRIRSWLKK